MFYVYVGIVKMSIALFNIRLTTLTTKFWKNVNWAFFALCAAYTCTALFLNVFKCRPQYASYDLLRIADSGKVPKCLSVNHMNSILRLNLALDFTALAIPVIVIWKVQMSWKKKARIFGLLSIGLIACIASVMTLVSQYTLEKDPLWNYTTLLAWIMVELVVSLIAACAPTLAYLLPRSMYSTNYASNSASKSTSRNIDTGFRSRHTRNDYALRARHVNGEDGDSEDDIIVQEHSKMGWQSRHRVARDPRMSDQSGGDSSLTSSHRDDRGMPDAVVHDGSLHGESTRALVSPETYLPGQDRPSFRTRPGIAI